MGNAAIYSEASYWKGFHKENGLRAAKRFWISFKLRLEFILIR